MEEQNLEERLTYILAAIADIQVRLEKLEKNRAFSSVITAGMSQRDKKYIDKELKALMENN